MKIHESGGKGNHAFQEISLLFCLFSQGYFKLVLFLNLTFNIIL